MLTASNSITKVLKFIYKEYTVHQEAYINGKGTSYLWYAVGSSISVLLLKLFVFS